MIKNLTSSRELYNTFDFKAFFAENKQALLKKRNEIMEAISHINPSEHTLLYFHLFMALTAACTAQSPEHY